MHRQRGRHHLPLTRRPLAVETLEDRRVLNGLSLLPSLSGSSLSLPALIQPAVAAAPLQIISAPPATSAGPDLDLGGNQASGLIRTLLVAPPGSGLSQDAQPSVPSGILGIGGSGGLNLALKVGLDLGKSPGLSLNLDTNLSLGGKDGLSLNAAAGLNLGGQSALGARVSLGGSTGVGVRVDTGLIRDGDSGLSVALGTGVSLSPDVGVSLDGGARLGGGSPGGLQVDASVGLAVGPSTGVTPLEGGGSSGGLGGSTRGGNPGLSEGDSPGPAGPPPGAREPGAVTGLAPTASRIDPGTTIAPNSVVVARPTALADAAVEKERLNKVTVDAAIQATPAPAQPLLPGALQNALALLDGLAEAGPVIPQRTEVGRVDQAEEKTDDPGPAPVITPDQDPDLPALQGAGLAADFFPFDTESLEAAVQQLLANLDSLGSELVRSRLTPWLMAVALAAAAGEIARRQWRKSRAGMVLAGSENAAWNWDLGLAGPGSLDDEA